MTDDKNVVGTILRWDKQVDKAFIKTPIGALQELGRGRGCNDFAFYLWLLHLQYKLRDSNKVFGGVLVTWETLQGLCGISRRTVARRLEELESKGFLRRSTSKSVDGSLAEYTIIVKPCYAEQQLEYLDEMVAEDIASDSIDFDHIYLNGTDIVIQDTRYNMEKALRYIIDKLGQGSHVMRAYNMLTEIGADNEQSTLSQAELNAICDKLEQEIESRKAMEGR